tara:strand:+ start:3645 stop:4151 length:507 start_codon:yes stop_codon:yes gene_type:complete
MSEYRDRTSGKVMSKEEVKASAPNISPTKVWNNFTFDAYNVDPILPAPKPTDGIGQYQFVTRNGAVQDAKDNWVEAWEIRDMFADTTDEDGKKTTKSEHEKAYQTQLDTNAASNNRSQRDNLLQETDWWAVSDRTMSSEQTAYRKALRDITTHSNWPHLENGDWPAKP